MTRGTRPEELERALAALATEHRPPTMSGVRWMVDAGWSHGLP